MVEKLRFKTIKRFDELNQIQRNRLFGMFEDFLETTYPVEGKIAESGKLHNPKALSKDERRKTLRNAALCTVLLNGSNVAGFISGYKPNSNRNKLHLTAWYAKPEYRSKNASTEIREKIQELPKEIVEKAHELGYNWVLGIDLLVPSRRGWKNGLVPLPIVEKGGFIKAKKTGVTHGFLKLKPHQKK